MSKPCDSAELGQRIAEIVRDAPTHTAWAAIAIASALIQERQKAPVSTLLSDGDDLDVIAIGGGNGGACQ